MVLIWAKPGARAEWLKVFGANGPDFDKVCAGETELTDSQIDMLLDFSILDAEKRAEAHYPGLKNYSPYMKIHYNRSMVQ